MSILGEVTQVPVTTAPAPAENAVAVLLIAAALFLFATGMAWAIGAFRRRSICGRNRLAPRMQLSRVVRVTLLSGFVWVMVQGVYGAMRPGMTTGDLAFLSTVPALFAGAVLLVGDDSLGMDIFRRLGLTKRNVTSALTQALLSMLVVMPLIWAASVLLDWLYRSIGYQHPDEHEMLGAMKNAPLHVRVLLTVGACVIAPVYEELLFRGHIQTIAVRALRGWGDGSAARWAAVVGTSVMFALVHPIWMAPLIFVLALCLGYAYERSGNLWLPILMHALFNMINTVQFLIFR